MDEVRKVLMVALHANVQPQLTMRGMWDNRCSQASVASNGTHRFKVTIPDKSSLNATQFVSELAAPLHQLGYVLTLLYCYKDILFVGVMNRNKSQNEGGRNKAQKRKYQEDPINARNGKRQKEIEAKTTKKQEKEEKEDGKKQTVEGGWAQAALEMVDVLAALRGKFTPCSATVCVDFSDHGMVVESQGLDVLDLEMMTQLSQRLRLAVTRLELETLQQQVRYHVYVQFAKPSLSSSSSSGIDTHGMNGGELNVKIVASLESTRVVPRTDILSASDITTPTPPQ